MMDDELLLAVAELVEALGGKDYKSPREQPRFP